MPTVLRALSWDDVVLLRSRSLSASDRHGPLLTVRNRRKVPTSAALAAEMTSVVPDGETGMRRWSPPLARSTTARTSPPTPRLQSPSRPEQNIRRAEPRCSIQASTHMHQVRARGNQPAAAIWSQTSFVMTHSDSPVTMSSLFRTERGRLLEVLQSLEPSDWSRPTRCPGWSVHGLSLHLLGDDLSLLSWQRDDHRGTPAPASLDEAGFITLLDALQVEWVNASRRLSPRLAVEMLTWLDGPIADLVDAQDSTAVDAYVSWASTRPVPKWLDQVRELSERWIHRQQILEALGRPPDLNPRSSPPGPGWVSMGLSVPARRRDPTAGNRGQSCCHRPRSGGCMDDGDRWRSVEVQCSVG